jgi:hypothetical protein
VVVLVAAADRAGASTARSGGSYAASEPITINAPIYLIQLMRRGYNIAKASDRQESGPNCSTKLLHTDATCVTLSNL